MISKVAWAGYVRRSWFWPHLILVLFFLTQLAKQGLQYENVMSAFELALSLVLMLMLFLGLNEGREELNRKTVIRLRTLPISWIEECMGSAMALLFYGVTLITPLFFIFIVMVQMNWMEVNITKWESLKMSNYIEDGYHMIKAPENLNEKQRMAVQVSFLDNGMGSDKSFAILKKSESNLDEDLMIKSKRVTYLPFEQAEVKLKQFVFFRGAHLELVLDKIYLLHEKQPFLLSMFNGALILLTHGLFLSVLFILLGRKVSIEVGVFFILGCLLIQSVYSLLGDELLSDAVKRLGAKTNSNFTSLWWEPYLLQWTKLLSEFEGLKALFEFNSIIDNWTAKKWIGFPLFEPQFLKELITFSIMLLLTLAMLKPKET